MILSTGGSAVVRQRSALVKYRMTREGKRRKGGFANLFGRARKTGRLGWVERRRAESRTRFKRKVLRVNGAEVMPRPQQQQPSSARVLHSLLPFSLFAPVLSLGITTEKKGRERKRDSFLSPRGFSPLLKHTLSSCLLTLSLSVAVFFACIMSRPFPSGEHATFSLPRRSTLFFFLYVVSSHTLETAPILVQLLSRTVTNKCIECKLPTNFFHRFVLALRVHARVCISLLGDICSQLFRNEVVRIRTPKDFTKQFRSHRYYRRMRTLYFLVSHLLFPIFHI